MALSDAEIQATKVPYGKNQFKVSDGAGLYLLVKSSGRYWKLAYRFEGKQKTLAFGVYPSVSLEAAREKRDAAKKLLAQHIDPGEIRKQQRMEQREAQVENDEHTASHSSHQDKKSLTQYPALSHPADQKIIAQRRLCILQSFEAAHAYRIDERALQQSLDDHGYRISFDRLRTDIAWLFEQQAVHIQAEAQTENAWVIVLTQSGLDAAQGRLWIPGIDRPAIDQAVEQA